MSKVSLTRFIKHNGFLSHQEVPPAFLVPALQRGPFATKTQFSTSAANQYPRKAFQKKKDSNPERGVSALRRTGLRHSVAMAKEPLPQPVLDPSKRSRVQVDKDHGLWGFFNKGKTVLSTPEEDQAHGIAPRRLRRWIYQLIRALKVGPGLLRNCGISRGRICIVYGGYVSRKGTDWQRRSTSVQGWKQVMVTSNPKSGRKKYVVIFSFLP